MNDVLSVYNSSDFKVLNGEEISCYIFSAKVVEQLYNMNSTYAFAWCIEGSTAFDISKQELESLGFRTCGGITKEKWLNPVLTDLSTSVVIDDTEIKILCLSPFCLVKDGVYYTTSQELMTVLDYNIEVDFDYAHFVWYEDDVYLSIETVGSITILINVNTDFGSTELQIYQSGDMVHDSYLHSDEGGLSVMSKSAVRNLILNGRVR